MPIIAQIDAWDPVAGAAVTLQCASHDDPAVCHLGGGTWWPAIAKLPALRYDLFDGAFTAQITAPSSTITVQTEPWPGFGGYILADARFRLWHGTLGDPIAAYVLRFDGRVSAQPKIQDGRAEIDFAVDDRWLDTALLALFAGTGGAEGPAALKGQAKPLALGAPRYVSGKLVDTVNSVFQVSAYGTVAAFEAALERLARFPAPIADYAGYAALVAATIPAGQWATARAVGMARFGAPPTGQISFLLQGDAAGTDGWARKPGQLIRRLAILSGGAGKIDDASLGALDVARPYNLSLYLDAQTTARDLIQKLAASVNAVAGVSWTGQLFVAPVAVGATTTVLAADGTALPAVSTVQQIDIASPYQKLAIGAERAWTVHALADIAFTATVVDLGLYATGTSYREGNVVNLSDGSRWLFTAAAPATGSAPAAGNANWMMLTGPTVAVYGDGTTVEALRPAQAGADKTSANTAAAIQGQAATATSSDFSAVTGSTKPANNATVGADVRLNVVDGSVTLTRDQLITLIGTAAAISGQAATATSSDFAVVTGSTKPANGATVGADVRVNVVDGSTNLTRDQLITSLGTAAAFTGQGALSTKNTASIDSDVTDGSTYARILASQLSNGQHRLTVPGSGVRLGDQRNAPQIATMNLRYKYAGAITYSATSTSATISVAATAVPIGSTSISYNALSATVSGSAGSTVTYFLYFDDPSYAGGTPSLLATTDGNAIYSNDGRVFVGSVAVSFPASGSGSGGGYGGGGGGGKGQIP